MPRMSPAILFTILVVSIMLFISGLVLLVMKLLKKQRLSSLFQSTSRHFDLSTSNAIQRQLHQLFHVHDTGLDQALIDVLPMFIYKDVAGLDGPFDCPVCLCEFSHDDKLRLLPLCKHAFHLNCIDTWLVSNSTCPLCRGTLFAPGFSPENPDFDLNDSRNAEGFSSVPKQPPDEIVGEKRVFSLRLGKFRHIKGEGGDIEMGETSNINLDGRRCFSMGSVQYVVADKEFQVSLCPNYRASRNNDDEEDGDESKNEKGKDEEVECNNKQKASNNNEGKKISNGNKRESFSISKVWLWPKKSKIPDERDNNNNNHFSKPLNLNVCLPTITPAATTTTTNTTTSDESTFKFKDENLDSIGGKDENLNLV